MPPFHGRPAKSQTKPAWTPPNWVFPVMGALWLSVLGATIAHDQIDLWAGLAFVPYLVWVSIAGVLNWEMVRLNPNVVALNSAAI